jgi:ectoine hydroxylase-related dioxygenase (phytanoyl-CoA dioxygenase family)
VRDELLRAVLTDGFTVVPDAVSLECVRSLRQELSVLIDDDRSSLGEAARVDDHMVQNLMVRHPVFLDLLNNAAIVDALDSMLSPTSIVYAYTSSSMPPAGTNYSARVHVDSPRVIPGYITNIGVIVALDDFTDDNGATYFLPGSFERLDPPSEEEFFAGARRVYPKAGDLVVFNARTFHFGGHNATSEARHAVTINACRSYMRQRFDYARMVPDDGLTPTQRRLLGFDVRVPTSLEEYYVPEDRRLYKAGQG